MKNLLYKELKLAMHPVCYVFTFLFPILIIIPNYPIFVCTLYIVPILSILFLGANKGKQSNDLFYTALLPVRKKDIVRGRMGSVMFMELGTLITASILLPIKFVVNKYANIPAQLIQPGMGIDVYVSTLGFGLLGYSIVNTFFFLMFYKSGRSITAPTLLSTFTYIPFMLIFTLILPIVNKNGYYKNFLGGPLYIQFSFLITCILIYILVNILVTNKASKELEKADL